MINTFTTSYAGPPPVPPRLGSRAPGMGRNAPLVWFLSTMLVLHMAGSLGGFFYLYHRSSEVESKFQGVYHEDLLVLRRLQECEDGEADSSTLLDCKKMLNTYKNIIAKISQTEGKVDLQHGRVPFHNSGAVAHMIVDSDKSRTADGKTLRWKREHSLLMNVVHITLHGTLRIRVSGSYYIYSQVTFSQWSPKTSLVHSIVRRRTTSGKHTEDVLLKSFCAMDSERRVCTSFQGGVFQLEKEEDLALNVSDMNLVSFDSTTTTFGLFMV